jgi:DNA polymerase III subunit chi
MIYSLASIRVYSRTDSMARIDFYVLPEQGDNDRQRFACALAAKAWRSGHSVYLHADSAESAADMDKLLWTYRDTSFVPHALADNADAAEVPIAIGWEQGPAAGADVLINLATVVPSRSGEFARIAEIVAGTENEREQARERYRQYREQGHELHNHAIDSSRDG